MTSERIAAYIAAQDGWRGTMLARIHGVIRKAAPALEEGWKWGIPVWTARGNVIAAAAFQDHVKVNFFQGALLDDPKGLFNAGLEAKATRAIDLHEKDRLDERAFAALVRAAVERNTGPTPTKARKSR